MTETVATVIARAANLIPARATNLRGDYLAVCSPQNDAPEFLRVEHQDRRATYRRTGERNAPGYAPAYFVTSYGILIAWVTLDGRTHYASDVDIALAQLDTSRTTARTIARHRDAIRAVWPELFAVDSQGVTSRPADDPWPNRGASPALGGYHV